MLRSPVVNQWALLFLGVSLVVWSPIKSLPYIIPFVSAITILLSKKLHRKNVYSIVLTQAAVAMFVSLAWLSIWWLVNQNFNIYTYILSYITYSAVIFAVLLPSKTLKIKTTDMIAIGKYARAILLFQGVIGIGQAVYGFAQTGTFDLSNGDWVKGTIGFSLSGYYPGGDISNALYAINQSVNLIFVWSLIQIIPRRAITILSIVIGTIGLALAAVMHAAVFLASALLLATLALARLALIKRISIILLYIFIISIFIGVTMPKNTSLIIKYAKQLIVGESLRSRFLERWFSYAAADNPPAFYLGYGIGQVTSRSALVASGLYLTSSIGKNMPLLGPTQVQQRYLEDLLVMAVNDPRLSSTHKPYSSWISLLTEVGIVGVLVLSMYYIYYIIIKMRNRTYISTQMSFASTTILIFILLLGFQENYWEMPQAIFLPILYFKILNSYMDGIKNETTKV